jgi:tRNA (guanosine-2'-O-)-methyltransferase
VAFAIAALSCAGTPAVGVREPAAATRLVSTEADAQGLTLGRSCSVSGLETCFNANDDNCNGLVDEGCGLLSGPLQIVVAWEEADVDVDLDVTDPNGEQAEIGRVTATGMTKDRDCPGRGDECGGQNFEVVAIGADRLPLGHYRVTLSLERPNPNGTLVHVRVGGHIGQDAISGEVVLSSEKPRISLDFQRSIPTTP